MRSGQRRWLLVAVLCVAAGISNVDIFGISYLTPFIQADLGLDNVRIGLLLSLFWLPFAISSYLTGAAADRRRNHKAILLAALVLFALGSVLPALTSMFATLLAARLLMGALDAAVYQLPQALVVLETPVERQGLYMGIVQNAGGSLLGVVIAPLLLVRLATEHGWRSAFLVVGIPALLCAALVARHVPARRPGAGSTAGEGTGRQRAPRFGEVLRRRNVWLSAVISCFIVGYMTITFGFVPLYLVRIGHWSASSMSIVMSVAGLSSAVLGVILPAASDRVGRKPVMILSSVLGLGTPLAVLYFTGPLPALCAFVFIGTAIMGAAPLTYATIPCESAAGECAASVIGFILATSAVAGGVIGPALAGWSADRWGLAAPLYATVACCAVVAMLCAALIESAPRKRSPATRRGAAPAALFTSSPSES
jgi:MFS family permease